MNNLSVSHVNGLHCLNITISINNMSDKLSEVINIYHDGMISIFMSLSLIFKYRSSTPVVMSNKCSNIFSKIECESLLEMIEMKLIY